VLVLSAYSIFDSFSIGISAGEIVLYLLYSIIVFWFGFSAYFDLYGNRYQFHSLSFLFFLISIFLIPQVMNLDVVVFRYLLVDYASLSIPILIYAFGCKYGQIFRNEKFLMPMLYALLIGACLAFVVSRADQAKTFGLVRFDPPSPLLIAIITVGLFSARKATRLLFFISVAMLLGYFSIKSGQRTSILLLFAAALFGVVFCSSTRRELFRSFLALVIAVSVSITFHEPITHYLGESRFSRLLEFEVDQSLARRFTEFLDIRDTYTSHGNTLNFFLGFGHGSTFESKYGVNDRNYTGLDNKVHHIHVSPILVIFRYGLLGVVLYLLLWFYSIVNLIRIRTYNIGNIYVKSLILANILFLLDGLARNVFVDPRMSLTIGATLYYYRHLTRLNVNRFGLS